MIKLFFYFFTPFLTLLFLTSCSQEIKDETPQVIKKSLSKIDSTIYDLEVYGNNIYALASNKIYVIEQTDTAITKEIPLPNISNAEGFCLDSAGNIFIADTTQNRVVKLLKNENYSSDTSFTLSSKGSDKGELLSPKDVTLTYYHDKLMLFVLDAGNKRIQLFNHVGAYLDDLDYKLSNPINMIGAPNLIISDENALIKLNYNFLTKEVITTKLRDTNALAKVTYSDSGILLPANDTLLFMQTNGVITKEIKTNQNNLIALAYHQNQDIIEIATPSSRKASSKNAQTSSSATLIMIEKTSVENNPTELTKQFISAYLNDDKSIMITMTSNKLITLLDTKQTQVKEVFRHSKSYRENIYLSNNTK
jgi:hypothetical protein